MKKDNTLSVKLNTKYKPFPGWKITKSASKYFVQYNGSSGKIYLGKRHRWVYPDVTTVGLSRPGYKKDIHEALYNPAKWNAKHHYWPELIFPTAWAESNADFTSMNFWDKAGFTPGFIQLAAHTADDLIPFMKQLILKLPRESDRFFPELKVIKDKLCFVSGERYRSLEVKHAPPDPFPKELVNRGLFVGYFNRNRKRIGDEEKQAAARWLIWTLNSPKMRKLQVEASIVNMKDSLGKLHKALLKDGTSKYPKGVHGMRCDNLAAALAVPHLSPRKVGIAVQALLQHDVLKAFEQIEYGPGDREKNVVRGVELRKKILSKLIFDLIKGHPVLLTS